MGGFNEGIAYAVLATAALAGGDFAAARAACEAAMRPAAPQRLVYIRGFTPLAEAAQGCGDLAAARCWADETIAVVPGWFKMIALTARAHVAAAQGQPEQALRDAHDALAIAARLGGCARLPSALECLACLATNDHSHQYAAQLLGAAESIRLRTSEARISVYETRYAAAVAAARDALGQKDFDAAWTEGAALSTEEAIGYAQRGRGERERPTPGWASLTATELDVVRLVSEGLANSEIATRLFVSPRTVQTHLTHVYTKLGLTSRMQLAQEAARHA
jgi:DNA-binding CsgD family transcriptional regulator